MPVDFDAVGNDRFDAVVVPHHFNFVNYSRLRPRRTVAFAVDFVIVPSDQQVANGVSRANLNLTVVST